MTGTLYLVSTPIGNLEDITLRAIRTLKAVDCIACEDTRQTRKLLEHLGIKKTLLSYHEHNENSRTPQILQKIMEGADIALVSDAGTPLVSDPGYPLVHEATARGIRVVPIPGASAALAALSASGLPSDSFHFVGFLPAKGARRREVIQRICASDATSILYEAPHRILHTLDELRQVLGDRPIVAARELTKIHEEFLRGTTAEVFTALGERPSIKGEFTIVVGKPAASLSAETGPAQLRSAVEEQIRLGVPRMDAIKSVAKKTGVPKRTVYRAVEESE